MYLHHHISSTSFSSSSPSTNQQLRSPPPISPPPTCCCWPLHNICTYYFLTLNNADAWDAVILLAGSKVRHWSSRLLNNSIDTLISCEAFTPPLARANISLYTYIYISWGHTKERTHTQTYPRFRVGLMVATTLIDSFLVTPSNSRLKKLKSSSKCGLRIEAFFNNFLGIGPLSLMIFWSFLNELNRERVLHDTMRMRGDLIWSYLLHLHFALLTLRSSLLCLPVKRTLAVYISNIVVAALQRSIAVPCIHTHIHTLMIHQMMVAFVPPPFLPYPGIIA